MAKWKRVLYTICFACIMLIDWSRGAADWVYWATCINLVGVVMSVIMAGSFSWQKQSWKKYALWTVMWLTGSVVGYVLWSRNPEHIFPTQYAAAALGILSLGMIALRIWSDRIELKNASIGHAVPIVIWGVMTVLMVCSEMGEIWQLYYFIIFGMFYLIPTVKKEKDELWISVADGCILGFLIIQIWAYGFRPYDEVRYKGAYANCNMNALFYLVTYIMVLFRLHYMGYLERKGVVVRRKVFDLCKCLFLLLAAGLCVFILYTMTRTAILVSAAITIVFGIYEFFVYRKVPLHKVLLGCAVYGMCILGMVPCVYLTIRYLPTILHHPVWLGPEYSIEKVHSFDPYDSEKYVSFDELIEGLLGRFGAVEADEVFGRTEEKDVPASIILASNGGAHLLLAALPNMGVNEEVPESSMSIRYEIYKKYLSNLNMTGHELEEGYFRITEDYHAWHAQNVVIQVLFYYGIPAGICFVVLMVFLGVRSVQLALRNKNVEAIMVLLTWLAFMGYGMLECVWYMGQSILFLMFLTPKILVENHS